MSKELKPCPVCGKYAVVCHIREINKDYCTFFRVECSEGCISTDNVKSKKLAIKLWNEWVDEYKRK